MSENHLVEWKGSWRDEYLRWICGFANAEGGTLVIGRNDAGTAVGVTDSQRLLVDLPNKIRDTLGIVTPVRVVREGDRELVEIDVEPSLTPISYRGEYHIRCGSTKQQLTGAALSAFLLRKFGRHWDSAPVPDVNVDDLDPAAFKRFRQLAKSGDRIPEDALRASNAELVDRLHLTEAGMLKRAALLVFHEDPERWFTGAYVKLGMFRTYTELLFHDDIHGDLFWQMEHTMKLLLEKYMIAWVHFEGLQRVERYPIPPAALREALLNALIHKDYASGNPIQIRVSKDSLWIWNEGPLPDRWTAQTLLHAHASRPANPDIAHTFYLSGHIEAWGRGYERIVEACREAKTPEPTVEYDGRGVWLKWAWVPPDESESSERLESQLESKLESQLESQLESTSLGGRVLTALHGKELSKSRISKELGQKQVSGALHEAIRALLSDGLIEMTLADRPQSRLQKYRLTEKGKTQLARLRRQS